MTRQVLTRGDEGAGLHDHPWDFVSIPLRGYREETEAGTVRHRAFVPILYRAEHRHRLIVDRPTITICFVLRTRRRWGLVRDGVWVFWRDALGISEAMQSTPPEDQAG